MHCKYSIKGPETSISAIHQRHVLAEQNTALYICQNLLTTPEASTAEIDQPKKQLYLSLESLVSALHPS